MDALVEALVPGMPAPARAKITAQAQGIPLFAVETVRSLIDRNIVQPIEGSYRLVGDIASWRSPTACTPCWPPGWTPSTRKGASWSPAPRC